MKMMDSEDKSKTGSDSESCAQSAAAPDPSTAGQTSSVPSSSASPALTDTFVQPTPPGPHTKPASSSPAPRVSPAPSPSAKRALSSTSDGFKTPVGTAPKRKRFQKTVLDEDNYIRELEGIIERDFFPDLRKLNVQNDYLSAAQSGDTVRLQELRERYRSDARPRPDTGDSWTTTTGAATPDSFETPRPTDTPGGAAAAGSAPASADEPVRPLSLNQYLATHTSEDDESFREMMGEARRRHRVRHPWLYAAEAAHNERQETLLALEVPSVEEQASGAPRPGQVATWRYRSENDLMYAPRGLALTAAEKIERAKRGQEIRAAHTRFTGSPFDEVQQREALGRVAQAQVQRRGGKIDVDGREHVEPAKRGMVRTPSPAPGVDQSPLMTWGQIDGTPFRMDGGDTPAAAAAPPTPSFRILEASKREQLARELADRASSRHRDKKARALETARRQAASPSVSDRLAAMSPAARRLAKAGRSTDRALRASYTPSPARRRPAPAPATPSPARLTPAVSPARSGAASITDNLLRLPTRQRAADFM